MKPTNKGHPLYGNESQTELYLEYIEVFFLMLSSDFHEEFAYNGKHDQWQRKGQDGNESRIKDYQQVDDTRWHLLQVQVAESLTLDWKGEGDGLQSSMWK